jgi:hypothetical protein
MQRENRKSATIPHRRSTKIHTNPHRRKHPTLTRSEIAGDRPWSETKELHFNWHHRRRKESKAANQQYLLEEK